ncbi:5'/3'-nucleotidase SurE [Streptomyces sp. NPDC005408]|uniref:5'/3'-nucleotidase SurE n=1 Tax=Streptomyces sp. NPDC005408 TaxID=3155341 RepID=UPI0033BD37BF
MPCRRTAGAGSAWPPRPGRPGQDVSPQDPGPRQPGDLGCRGPNVAGLATHSGTVGGAVAALEHGIPAIALSTGSFSAPDPGPTVNAMRPTVDFAVKLIERLRSRAKSGPLLPQGVGLNINHPVVGADGTGTADDPSLTFQDPQTVLEPAFTDSGDGTWKVRVNFAPQPAGKGSDVEALMAGRIAIRAMTANWNTGPVDFARTSSPDYVRRGGRGAVRVDRKESIAVGVEIGYPHG